MDDKSHFKGAWYGLHGSLLILGAPVISLEWLKLESSNFDDDRMINHPVVRVAWPIISFYARSHIFGTTEVTVAKYCVQVEYIKC